MDTLTTGRSRSPAISTREGEGVEPDARIRIIPIQHGPTDRGAGARETAEAAGDPSGSGHPDLP